MVTVGGRHRCIWKTRKTPTTTTATCEKAGAKPGTRHGQSGGENSGPGDPGTSARRAPTEKSPPLGVAATLATRGQRGRAGGELEYRARGQVPEGPRGLTPHSGLSQVFEKPEQTIVVTRNHLSSMQQLCVFHMPLTPLWYLFNTQ